MTPDDAIKFFGSQKALAEACEISPAAVSLWVAKGAIPRDRQYQVQVLSRGKLRVALRQEAKAIG